MDDFIDSEAEMSQSSGSSTSPLGPFVKIIEQPAKCGVRFRYECEGRISGAIPGAFATTTNPTYPTIQIMNYRGRAKIVVSCVTKNLPYRPHPHNLVGKKSCKDGVCVLFIDNEDMVCTFTNLGILCAKRKDIKERLKTRELLNVDPFGTGFGHKAQAFKMIDLAVVRLCFQVYLEGPQPGEFCVPLEPVVSDPIYDKKAMSELAISKLSHYSAPCTGGTEVILLCDRVIKDDIQIRFFEEKNEQLIWESFAEFKSSDIHKHFAISFRSPKYCDENIQTPVAVNVQLKRPSDGGTSEALPFYILPKSDQFNNKRQRITQINSLPYHVVRATNQRNSNNLITSICSPRYQHQTSQEYILPRLLTQPIGQEVYTQDDHSNSNCHQDFLDLDIGALEENINDFGIASNHLITCNMIEGNYWNNNEVCKEEMSEINSNSYVMASSDDILDISANTNIKSQWSLSKPFLTAIN